MSLREEIMEVIGKGYDHNTTVDKIRKIVDPPVATAPEPEPAVEPEPDHLDEESSEAGEGDTEADQSEDETGVEDTLI